MFLVGFRSEIFVIFIVKFKEIPTKIVSSQQSNWFSILVLETYLKKGATACDVEACARFKIRSVGNEFSRLVLVRLRGKVENSPLLIYSQVTGQLSSGSFFPF